MDESSQARDAARLLIERHEGYSQFPVPDAHNTVEVGYGLNLTRRGLLKPEADWLVIQEVNRLHGWLTSFPFFEGLSVNRQVALIDMAYNLGEGGFEAFGHMLSALSRGDFIVAADAMLNSKWAQEVYTRAHDDADLMRKG